MAKTGVSLARIQDQETRLLIAEVGDPAMAVGEHLWRRLGFEPVLTTAVADRKETERALRL